MEVGALVPTVLEEVFRSDDFLDGEGGGAGDGVSLFEEIEKLMSKSIGQDMNVQ